MKKTVKILCLFMFCSFISLNIQTITSNSAILPKKISLNTSKKTMYVKQSLQLNVKSVAPQGASKAVTWKSSNKNIALVTTSGKVTAKKEGTVKIEAVSKAKKSLKATCTIQVKKFKQKKVAYKKSNVLMIGNMFQDVYGYNKKINYKVFKTYEEYQRFLKAMDKGYLSFLPKEMSKKINSYKKSFFTKKTLCIMIAPVKSLEQKVTIGSLEQVQSTNGKVVGRLSVKFHKKGANEKWSPATGVQHIFMEIDKKDADVIDTYQIKKVN